MSEQENEHTTEEESIEEEEDTSTDDYESLEEKSTDSDEEALIHTFNSVPLDVEVLKAYGGITDNMNLSPRATQIKGDRTSRGNSGGGKHNNQSTMTRSQSKENYKLIDLRGGWAIILLIQIATTRFGFFCDQLYDCNILQDTEKQVTCTITNQDDSIIVTAIYAECKSHLREPLWDDLRHMAYNINLPWLIAGDFNCVLDASEKKGGNLHKMSDSMPVMPRILNPRCYTVLMILKNHKLSLFWYL
ncbi:hypothetical protein FXO38_17725 [Capsicum annuum]|nr:hypothetical protein FXO37_24702 [Capsicum annuum]KAF3649302.1 hypothetical protein FXO38_17725 [Capsicum annuum]